MILTEGGSGKSTFLAAILRDIIEEGERHVCTYEAPIEFDFDAIPTPIGDTSGSLSQSTIPEHLQSFLVATRNSTRTAPKAFHDVVLALIAKGESRNPETLQA